MRTFANIAAAATRPEPATSHSGSAQGSGRYLLRPVRRPPTQMPSPARPRAPPPDPDPQPRQCRAGQQHRHAEPGGGAAVEQPVDTDTDPEQPSEDKYGCEPPRAAARVRRTPVATGVHRGGEFDGPVERTLEDRHRESPERAETAGVLAAEPVRLPHAGRVGHQLGGEGERDDTGDTDLVQRTGHLAEQ